MKKNTLMYTTALICCATIQSSYAQTGQSTPEDQAEAVQSSSQQADSAEIVVTGTRITRSGYNAPTPTTVVGGEDLAQRGLTNVADLLNAMPAFGGSTTPSTTARSSQNAGGNFLNLRSLGASRTLTLVDGQRFVPTTATGLVDINVIPTAMIERVDVVTGGASAAYGSDAVAGVANIIIRKNIDGLEASVQAGVSERGDAQRYDASLVWGRSYADGRIKLNIGDQYSDNKGIPRRSNRNWAAQEWGLVNNPAYTPSNGQSQIILAPNVHVVNAAPGGLITSGPLKGTLFLPNGQTSQFHYGSAVGSSYMIGGDGINFGRYASSLTTPLERESLFGQVDFEVSDALTLFVNATYARSHTRYDLSTAYDLGTITITRDNAYLPASVGAAMDLNGITSFKMGRINDDIAWNDDDVTNTTQRYVIGGSGKFGDTWKWNAYYQYGRTDYDAYIYNNRIKTNWVNSIDAVVDPSSGRIVCRSTLTTPGNGCVPVNLFGYGSPSPAVNGYISATQALNSVIRQDAAGVSLSGEPFSLWAGPVSIAVGAEYRKESVNQKVDALSQAGAFEIGNPKAFGGKYTVKEAFGEIVLPLWDKSALLGSASLNGAIRLTDYSTSGSVTTWKIGGTWNVTDDLLLRSTRSRDIRAPNLTELFSAYNLTFATVIDPALNQPTSGQQITVRAPTFGNTQLVPETADTLTIGVTYQPHWLRGFQASVDYYNIDIAHAITTLTAGDIVNSCKSGNQALCALLVRQNGALVEVQRPFVNIANISTKGLDLEAGYRTPLGGGTLGVRGLVTYVDKLMINGIDRAGDAGYSNSGLPHWRWNASATYSTDNVTMFLEGRYIGGGKLDNTYNLNGVNNIASNKVSSQFLLNSTLTFHIGGKESKGKEFFLSVQNILDKDPPISPFSFIFSYATNPTLYDVTGRNFTAGFRVKF